MNAIETGDDNLRTAILAQTERLGFRFTIRQAEWIAGLVAVSQRQVAAATGARIEAFAEGPLAMVRAASKTLDEHARVLEALDNIDQHCPVTALPARATPANAVRALSEALARSLEQGARQEAALVPIRKGRRAGAATTNAPRTWRREIREIVVSDILHGLPKKHLRQPQSGRTVLLVQHRLDERGIKASEHKVRRAIRASLSAL